jgi:hypothetical protein
MSHLISRKKPANMRNICWNCVVKSVASSGEQRARDVRSVAMP